MVNKRITLPSTNEIVSNGLVKFLQKYFKDKKIIPVRDDPFFMGADMELTANHFGAQVGYSMLYLDRLVVRPDREMRETYKRVAIIEKGVLPHLDAILRTKFPGASYEGARYGKRYDMPYQWYLPLSIFSREF